MPEAGQAAQTGEEGVVSMNIGTTSKERKSTKINLPKRKENKKRKRKESLERPILH